MAAQDLCSLADVKSALETTDASRDTLIGTLITQASNAIMDETNREFAPASTGLTRRFRVDGYIASLDPFDLRSATTVTLNPETTSPTTLTTTTDYQLLPIINPNNVYTSIQFSGYLAGLLLSNTALAFGYSLVDITGNWGFATVPVQVNRACVLTVSSWLRRDIMSFALSSEINLGRKLAPALPAGFAIPADARRLLQSYYRLRHWGS